MFEINANYNRDYKIFALLLFKKGVELSEETWYFIKVTVYLKRPSPAALQHLRGPRQLKFADFAGPVKLRQVLQRSPHQAPLAQLAQPPTKAHRRSSLVKEAPDHGAPGAIAEC